MQLSELGLRWSSLCIGLCSELDVCGSPRMKSDLAPGAEIIPGRMLAEGSLQPPLLVGEQLVPQFICVYPGSDSLPFCLILGTKSLPSTLLRNRLPKSVLTYLPSWQFQHSRRTKVSSLRLLQWPRNLLPAGQLSQEVLALAPAAELPLRLYTGIPLHRRGPQFSPFSLASSFPSFRDLFSYQPTCRRVPNPLLPRTGDNNCYLRDA